MLNNNLSDLVTVVIPYHKKINFINRCIKSVLNQTFQNFEIILIYDDNDFNELDDYAANEKYYKQYIPYINKSQNNPNYNGNKDLLFEKLNYMIHILEENKDQKTQNVTEELVLYMFLGVFVIFVVDSFAKAGKYTR